ncbi:hypothetical protein ACIRD9_08320 [Streptomyces violaceus]|uniref:hypothetical protein n=1 Tax=Streptomyces violaceus TaxID=1936 RepID=UPI00380B6C1F
MTESPTATAAEIKISFAGTEAEAASDALAVDRGEGRRRAIHFWDRPQKSTRTGVSLPLLDRGVILRLRRDHEERGSQREADMTVKLRPCPALPSPWQNDREGEHWEFTIEEDRTGPAFTPVVSASLQAERKFESVLEVERGSLDHALMKPQLELLETVGLTEDHLEDLTALGPVHAVKWKQDWDAMPRPVAIEEWTTDNNLRFLEVSVRTSIAGAAEVERLLEQALRERDITLPQSGETKTRAVITALARDLRL